MDLRWIQPKKSIKYQLFFSPSLQTAALLQLANFYTVITVFNLSGGDQPRPDDPHPFFAWGSFQVRAGDGAN